MTLKDCAQRILEKVYDSTDYDKYTFKSANKNQKFLLISSKGCLRWIVPELPKFGNNVLADWTPYDNSSRIKWLLLRVFYRLNLLFKVPSIIRLDFTSKKLESKQKRIVVPVIYVGTSGPQQKAVVTLVEETSGKTVAIMKLALGEKAKISIKNEAETLMHLPRLGFHGAPKILKQNHKLATSWQTVIAGKLSSRLFSPAHFSWLVNLPKTGDIITLVNIKKDLVRLYSSYKRNLTIKQQLLIDRTLASITCDICFSLIVVHGDFAPWNIKNLPNQKIAVFDWEDSNLSGLPLWDLCHFHLIQYYLFGEKKWLYELIDSGITESYLKQFGLPLDMKSSLITCYILFMVLDEKNNTTSEYREFLLSLMPSVKG